MLELMSFLFALTLPFSVVFLIPWLWVVAPWLLAVADLLVTEGCEAVWWLDCPGWRALLLLLQLPLLSCFPLGAVLILVEADLGAYFLLSLSVCQCY